MFVHRNSLLILVPPPAMIRFTSLKEQWNIFPSHSYSELHALGATTNHVITKRMDKHISVDVLQQAFLSSTEDQLLDDQVFLA
jgi:hypothetical protein